MPNQCCSSDFSFAFIQPIIYNRMLWLRCARCGLCLSHPPCHGPFSWIPSKLRLQYRLGDPAPLGPGPGEGGVWEIDTAEVALAFWWVAASSWREGGWGKRTALPSGQELCLCWVKKDKCFLIYCCCPPFHLLCLVVGSSVCHLALSSRPALTLGVLMSCALSGFWLKTLCKGGGSWTVIQTPSYLEFLGPFERVYLCVLTYWKSL